MTVKFFLQKKYKNFSLDVEGEFQDSVIGIFGESGSGKTTWLKCLAGFLNPDQWAVDFDGKIYFSALKKISVPIEKRDMGFVSQESLLFPHLTVRQNILYGRKPGTSKTYVDEVIIFLDIFVLLERLPGTLSRGEQQRVALARALIRRPALLLLDEPVCSLDLKSRYQILTYIRKMNAVFQMPMIYVSHSVSEMLFLAQEVFVLEHGRIVDSGHPRDVLLKPNIFPNGQPADIENIFELSVLEVKRKEGVVAVDFGGFSLCAVFPGNRICPPRLKIGLPSENIIISQTPVQGISARNVIPAKLERVFEVNNNFILCANINGKICLVEIRRSAYEQLQLRPGHEVFLIIKANAIKVFE